MQFGNNTTAKSQKLPGGAHVSERWEGAKHQPSTKWVSEDEFCDQAPGELVKMKSVTIVKVK